MKKYLKLFLLLSIPLLTMGNSCETETYSPSDSEYSTTPCGYHNGHRLYKGPRGGCYYINSNGNKTYVDRSECNC